MDTVPWGQNSPKERFPISVLTNEFGTKSGCLGHLKKTPTLYYPFREILAVIPGCGYSSRKSRATQSYNNMLFLFVLFL